MPTNVNDILATLLHLEKVQELVDGTTVIIVNADGSSAAIIGEADLVIPVLQSIADKNSKPEEPEPPSG